MLDHDLDTDQDQNDSTDESESVSKTRAHPGTDLDTDEAVCEGDDADDQYRRPDRQLPHGKADPNGQGIDAGGHRQHQ